MNLGREQTAKTKQGTQSSSGANTGYSAVPSSTPSPAAHKAFDLLLGALLGVAIWKFGNPVILDRLIDTPANLVEVLYQPWPVSWGFAGFFLLVILGFLRFGSGGLTSATARIAQWPKSRKAICLAPIPWLAWQLIASVGSVDPALSSMVVKHFVVCVGLFYLVLLSPADSISLKRVMYGLIAGFCISVWTGLEQKFGGLEATLKMVKEQGNWESLNPDYKARLLGMRVFGTMVYPNAFAGVILLLLPLSLVTLWDWFKWLSVPSRSVIVGTFAVSAAGCLYWTGSKSGWLVAMVAVVANVIWIPGKKSLKLAFMALVVVAALAGFALRFQGYFKKGATSVVARADYWRAACLTFAKNPIKGSGPGTFGVEYKKIKKPESEMAQLAHNDYLEQACDSGVIGFVSYSLFVLGSIFTLYRYSSANVWTFCLWIGLLSWSIQGLSEFTLYVPGISWAVFFALGYLSRRELDRSLSLM